MKKLNKTWWCFFLWFSLWKTEQHFCVHMREWKISYKITMFVIFFTLYPILFWIAIVCCCCCCCCSYFFLVFDNKNHNIFMQFSSGLKTCKKAGKFVEKLSIFFVLSLREGTRWGHGIIFLWTKNLQNWVLILSLR